MHPTLLLPPRAGRSMCVRWNAARQGLWDFNGSVSYINKTCNNTCKMEQHKVTEHQREPTESVQHHGQTENYKIGTLQNYPIGDACWSFYVYECIKYIYIYIHQSLPPRIPPNGRGTANAFLVCARPTSRAKQSVWMLRQCRMVPMVLFTSIWGERKLSNLTNDMTRT